MNTTTTPSRRPLAVIVDDDLLSQDLLKQFLKHIGLETRIVSNGEEAYAIIKATKPAFVLIDLSLSTLPEKKDGWDVLKDMKNDPETASIPAITISAYHSDEIAVKAHKAGFAAALPKPFQRAALYPIIKRLLSR